MNRPDPTDRSLLIAFLVLASFPVQYALRRYDDNTLARWGWVFQDNGMLAVFVLLLPALALAFLAARLPLDDRRQPVFLFTVSFLMVAFLWDLPEVIVDASRYVLQAQYLALHGPAAFLREWGREVHAWTDLPLVPFLYGLIFRFFGEERTLVQLFTTTLFGLAVVQTCSIGRRLWDRETGFLAGVLLLAMPYVLTQVPLMLVDVPGLFLFTLAVRSFLAAVARGGALRIAAAAAAAAGAALAKYSLWPMLLVLPLIPAVWAPEGRPAAVRRSLAVFGAAAAVVGAVLLLYGEVTAAQIAMLRAYQWPALGRWREGFLSTFLFQVHPLVTVAALAGVAGAVRGRDLRFLVPAWFVLFLLCFQVERIRYLVPLFPLFALMAARGLRSLSEDIRVGRFAALAAAAASLVLVLAAYRPFLESTTMANLRDAGSYLDTLPGEAVVVRVLPQRTSLGNTEAAVPLLDLFTNKRIVYERGAVVLPGEDALRYAPLRFTWEQRLPKRYDGPAAPANAPLAVISDSVSASTRAGNRPAERRRPLVEAFGADTGTFRYRTVVTVHHH